MSAFTGARCFADTLTFVIHERVFESLFFVLFFSLQGYDESYTDASYESYDNYYNQPQA